MQRAYTQVLRIYCYNQNDSISANVNNLLLNGSFENNNCTPNDWFNSSYCPNSNYYNCNIDNWICTGGGTETYADIIDINYANVVHGTKAAYFGNSYAKACSNTSNDTSCLINSGCTVTGIPAGFPLSATGFGETTGLSLEQTVSGLQIGNTYVLEFWAGGEANQGLPGLFAVDLGFGKTMLRCRQTAPLTGIGTRYIIEFNATATSHTIKFTNWGHITGITTELILDDVRLYTQDQLSPTLPECILSFNERKKDETFSIYPNPATESIIINSNLVGKNFSIISTLGELVIGGKITNENFKIQINNLSAGLYLLSLDEQKKTFEIVK